MWWKKYFGPEGRNPAHTVPLIARSSGKTYVNGRRVSFFSEKRRPLVVVGDRSADNLDELLILDGAVRRNLGLPKDLVDCEECTVGEERRERIK